MLGRRVAGVLVGVAALASAGGCAPPELPSPEPPPRAECLPPAAVSFRTPARISLPPDDEGKACPTFRVAVEAGALVRIVAEQRGADVELWLDGPDGEELQHADRDNRDRGEELLLTVAPDGGEYVLRVEVTRKQDGGLAVLRIDRPRPPAGREARIAHLYGELQTAKRSPRTARFEELAVGFEELGEPLLQAESLLSAGLGSANAGKGARVAPLRRAAEIFEREGARVWEGVARRPLAGQLLNEGRTAEALVEAERMRLIAEELDWPWLYHYAMRHRGQALLQRGQNQEALESFAAVLEGDGPPCEDPLSDAWHHLALLQARIFHRGDRALPFFAQALECYEDDGDKERQATVIGQIGRVYLDQGRLAEADAEFERALDVDPELSDCKRAKLLARRAVVARKRPDRELALDLAEQAQGLLDGAQRAAEADTTEPDAVEDGEVCQDGEEGDAPFQLADIWVWNDQPERASDAYQRALGRAQRVGNPILAARSEIGLARLASAGGQAEEALQLAQAASGRMMAVRLEVENEDNRLAFFENAQDAFDLYVRLLAADGMAARALEVAEAARGREFYDRVAEVGVELVAETQGGQMARLVATRRRLRELDQRRAEAATVELRQELQREREVSLERLAVLERAVRERRSAPTMAPETLDVAGMQAQLDAGTLLLVYRLGEEASFLWEVDRGSVLLHPLKSRSEIGRLVDAAVDSLARNSGTADLCRLSRLVLDPVAGRLRSGGDRQLVIAADGALQRLPFAALPIVADGEFCGSATSRLVELLPIVVEPSLSSLARLREARAARKPAELPLLAIGDAVYGPPDPRCDASAGAAAGPLERLPASGAEARGACQAYGGTCRTGFEASRDRVLVEDLGRFRTLLFAVHGEIDEAQPLVSSLVFGAGDASCRTPLQRLFAYEIATQPLSAELTVLSACSSALGPEIGGEGLVNGLVQSFLIAGSARVVATLWSVNDEWAAELVTRFFDHLHDGLPPPEALRRAQLDLRQRGVPAAGWAPFVLFGEWQPPPS